MQELRRREACILTYNMIAGKYGIVIVIEQYVPGDSRSWRISTEYEYSFEPQPEPILITL
jgi:hypothetical protein